MSRETAGGRGAMSRETVVRSRIDGAESTRVYRHLFFSFWIIIPAITVYRYTAQGIAQLALWLASVPVYGPVYWYTRRSGCSGLLGAVGVDGGPISPFGFGLCRGHVTVESLIELDRDTLHTRLGSSHECHSGVGRCAFALVSCMPVRFALHGLSHRLRLLLLLIRIEARASQVRALPVELS
uniref:Uncharacterized protein n=1 Tax=Ananas comosus var. bracteatus TaxID=296719 RepID=A0A6V7PQ29_ANACO|nr:unnamed protein product [Ananas comosus var. bracteatus]